MSDGVKDQKVILTPSELHQEETLPVSFMVVPLGWKRPWNAPLNLVPKSAGTNLAAMAGAAMMITNRTNTAKYKQQYFLTILFLNLACFKEKIGGLISLEGFNQNNMVECHLSINGMNNTGN